MSDDQPKSHLTPYAGEHLAATTERTILEVEVEPALCMRFMNCMRIATGGFSTDPATGKTRPSHWRRVPPAELWKAGWSCPSGAIRFVTDRGYLVPRWDEAAHWRTDSHPAVGRRRPG